MVKEIIKIALVVFLGITGMFIITLGTLLVPAYLAHSSVYAETSIVCSFIKNNQKQEYWLGLSSNVYIYANNSLSFSKESGIKYIQNDTYDYSKKPGFEPSISLLDDNKNYDSNLTYKELIKRINNYCNIQDRSFTCVSKEKNIMKYEFMKWGYKSYGDYDVEKFNFDCSSDFNNQLEKISLKNDYLFCVFDEVTPICKKEKRYISVD